MSFVTLSNPSVIVNDENIRIVPNTLRFKAGFGETNVRAASIGNGRSESVHSVDVETTISEVMFDVYVTQETSDLIRTLKDNIGGNVIKFTQRVNGVDVAKTFNGQSLTNDPEQEATADGKASFEFKGDQGI